MAIQLFTPKFEVQECLNEIQECLEKGWTGLGFKTVQLEEKWKRYTGLPFAYYMNSATIGLNFAVEILKEQNGWEDGDEIITTPITFISTNHAIPRAGLKAVFADIDNTMCLNPESVKERITEKTRAVIFVGIGGNAGHYDDIVRICKERGLRLILDAAHMAGTRVSGKMPGHEADAVIYSFQAVKNLPTADSGMLCFKDGKLDEIARKKGWLGINKDTYTRTTNSGNYKWRYDVEYIGEKAHGNSVIAAIAIVQLRYLDRDNAYRRQIARWYQERFAQYAGRIKLADIPKNCESSSHLFQILVENRDEVIVNLNRHGIYPGVHYADNTLYQMYAYDRGKCPYAAYVSEHILSLPMHLQLSYDDVQFISDRVIEIVNEFSQT
ncbi:MAG: DegT/DnrJ/EryC1/StrS family aminotransferase [Eubacterium sp.]|jgi:dTDP-4-amino-4,6-dideoxygalactose transaminase|nr:DegT/DnrJ/EryC1/StrS family aminotransferase [Eubacterium sp.]